MKNNFDYRRLIVEWVEKKKRINPRYNMSSLSRRLGFKTSSALSNILSGKRSISSQHAQTLAAVLGLNSVQTNLLLEAIAKEKLERKGFKSDSLKSASPDYNDEVDMFDGIKAAHYFACAAIKKEFDAEYTKKIMNVIESVFKISGKRIFDELAQNKIIEKTLSGYRPAGKRSGIYFRIFNKSDRTKFAGVLKDFQEIFINSYLNHEPSSSAHIAFIRVKNEDISSFRAEVIDKLLSVYEKYSYQEAGDDFVGIQFNLLQISPPNSTEQPLSQSNS